MKSSNLQFQLSTCLSADQIKELSGEETTVVLVQDSDKQNWADTLAQTLKMIDLPAVGSFHSLLGRNFYRPRSLKAKVNRDGAVISYPSILIGDSEVRIFVPGATDIDIENREQLAKVLDEHFVDEGGNKLDARFVSKDYDNYFREEWDDNVTTASVLRSAISEVFDLTEHTKKNSLARRVALIQLLTGQSSLIEMLGLTAQQIIELDPERKSKSTKPSMKMKVPSKPSELKMDLVSAIEVSFPKFLEELKKKTDLTSFTEDEIKSAFWSFLSA